eukprot:1462641-Pleurochrysis_carterae.AAC.5
MSVVEADERVGKYARERVGEEVGDKGQSGERRKKGAERRGGAKEIFDESDAPGGGDEERRRYRLGAGMQGARAERATRQRDVQWAKRHSGNGGGVTAALTSLYIRSVG